MAEYLTKEEYEKDAYDKRHDFVNNKLQPIINKIDEKMDRQEKSIYKLESNVESLHKDIHNGFKRIEEKLATNFATKLEVQIIKTDTDSNSAIIKWVIGVVTSVFTAGAIYLLIGK